MAKPYIIGIVSQKGGVGKTTIAVNLSVALKMLKYNVLLTDADSFNPTVGFLLGLDDANIGYRDVLLKKTTLQKAISLHTTSGLHVLTGTVYSKAFTPTAKQINDLRNELLKTNYDFIIIDTSPGFLSEDIINCFDESILIATPDMPALSSCIRLGALLDKHHKKYELVVNRVKNKSYELHIDEIEEAWKERVYSTLPEEDAVPQSVSRHIPLLITSRRNIFSRGINNIASKFSGRTEARFVEEKGGIIAWILRIFGLGFQ